MPKLSRAILITTCLAPLHLAAKDVSYQGQIHTETASETADMARGRVFHDENRNTTPDDGETGIEGVLVSNGREVVVTDANGEYEIPAYDDMNLFITKPAGYAVPLNDVLVPQFNYTHKIAGSPDLRFGGIEPTGPLPAAINFPLIEDAVGDAFSCLVFGDAQPYSNMEISYVRETVGRLLANRDNQNTECLIFEGDVMGDDLSLYPRFKSIIAEGGVPQYFVPGNHDLDLDADADAHSFDTFRREWGPEYYSFDIGNVHFVVLDNVRYPCNGVDDHAFCEPDARKTYNGVIHERQLTWLENDLQHIPEDKLVILNAHIPFQTFTDNTAAKHQTDNLDRLAEIVSGRTVLGLSGHTHTTENIRPGENFEGWEEHTHVPEAPFHQIITGAVSGSWWHGDLNDDNVPRSTQRLGSPRGYYQLDFDGSHYIDTFKSFSDDEDRQMHASFNTPRFRDWAEAILDYTRLYGSPSDVLPPVDASDLGDLNMLTRNDLEAGTWLAINVWNGSHENEVTVTLNDGSEMTANRTQEGNGEAKKRGPAHADPLAFISQASQSRHAMKSAKGGDEGAGYHVFRGTQLEGVAGPLPQWLLTDSSQHLWRLDLPADLPVGVHELTITNIDHHGREFTETLPFEVVETLPNMQWQAENFE